MLVAPPPGNAPRLVAADEAVIVQDAPEPNLLLARESSGDEFLEALMARRENGPERKLLKLVEFDENHAATVLKQWIRQGANE